MNSDTFSELIRVNIFLISQKTVNLDPLISSLFGDKVLEINEMETIRSKATSFERCSELYTLIIRKGKGTYKSVIKSLEVSGNQQIADILSSNLVRDESKPINIEKLAEKPNKLNCIEIEQLKTLLNSKTISLLIEGNQSNNNESDKLAKKKMLSIETKTTELFVSGKTSKIPAKMNQYAPFNYGESFGDKKIPGAYDLETPVNFPLKFHGNQYSYTRIKTNGFIKFAQNDDFPLIALYYAGIDTREAGSIYYRVTSKIEELDLARVLIERIIPGEIKLIKLLIVTYHEVPFEKAAKTTTNCPGLAFRNTFQGILAIDGLGRSFMIFNYIDLNWGPLTKIEDKFCTGYSETVKVGFLDAFRTQLSFDNILIMNNQSFSNTDLLTKSNVGFPGVFINRIDEPTKNFLKFNSTISFGTSNEDSKLAVGFNKETLVNYPFHMYGKLHSALKVNNRGFLFYPGDQNIYIFLAHIDTTYGGSVSYRVSSKFEDLNLAQILIERADPANEGLKLTSTLIVTFQDVPFYKSDATLVKCPETPRNTFECVLATDGVRSFVIFNYIQLNWGAKIHDDPCTGYHLVVYAGFHDGNSSRLLDNTKGNYSIKGSNYKDLLTKTNIGIPGVIVTRVDQIPPD